MSENLEKKKEPSFSVERVPPERGVPIARYGGACCTTCCCCCCCCGHSIGGVAGAMIGNSSMPKDPKVAPPLPEYWKLVAWLSTAIVVLGFGIPGAFGVLFLLPLIQLVASFVVAWRLLGDDSPHQAALWKRWRRVTGGTLIGSILGGVLTYIFFNTR